MVTPYHEGVTLAPMGAEPGVMPVEAARAVGGVEGLLHLWEHGGKGRRDGGNN